MTRRAALAAMLGLWAGAAAAGPGVPGADYFRGMYERIGRGGGPDAGFVNDRVMIEPAGTNLSLSACAAQPLILVFDPWSEIENLLVGRDGATPVWCLFHNNGDNYPILTCRTAAGGAYTLWPVVEDFDATALDCAP